MPITLIPETASSVDLSIYALTDLDSAKRRLQIADTDTSSDTIVTELINQVSAEIERITGVNFKARDYREWKNGVHQRQLTLGHYPVQFITRLSFGCANAFTVTYTGTDIRANVSVFRNPELWDDGGMRLVSVSSTGVVTSNNLQFATYKSVSELVIAINLISGWSATTQTNVPTGDIHPTAGQDAKGLVVTFTYPDLDDFAYSVDNRSGLVRFDTMGNGYWAWWNHQLSNNSHRGLRMALQWQGILVEYRAGYETIPADVQLIANELISDTYFEAQTGRGVTELKLGTALIRLDRAKIDDLQEQLESYIDHSTLIGDS